MTTLPTESDFAAAHDLLVLMETPDLPEREPDGAFRDHLTWVNHAASWIGGTNPLCADAKGRLCPSGKEFARARDEGTFPVYFWYGAGSQTEAQQRKAKRDTRRIIGKAKYDMREAWYGR